MPEQATERSGAGREQHKNLKCSAFSGEAGASVKKIQ
jgi:hypothetical protein